MSFDRRLFLPVSQEDMRERGWYYYDFLLITGDAYVDHPSFGPAIIGRALEHEGYRVAVLAQPDWHSAEAFLAMGKPRYGVLIGGGNIMMMKDEHKAAAWELMKFLSSKENSLKYCEDAGYISPRTDAVAESTVWQNDPILSVYTQQLAEAMPRGPHPKWPEISSALQFAYQDVLSGTSSVEDALNKAAAEIEAIK